MDPSRCFDRVVVVNLAHRPQRLRRFLQSLPADWPFPHPQRFEAVDGRTVAIPPEFPHGPGAWGCMLSHRQLLRTAIADGLDSILILEDDAVCCENFAPRAAEFLDRVPANWDCLMLGGQHLLPPLPVAPGIVRCLSAHRTHAYAVRRTMMPGLLHFWESISTDHCDIILAACDSHFAVYAPTPFLMGQSEGLSDVTLRFEPSRHFSSAA